MYFLKSVSLRVTKAVDMSFTSRDLCRVLTRTPLLLLLLLLLLLVVALVLAARLVYTAAAAAVAALPGTVGSLL